MASNAYSGGAELFSAASDTMRSPHVLHEDGLYHLFYALDVSGTWYIYKRSSPTFDGLATATGVQVLQGESISVCKYGSTFYMTYEKTDISDAKNKLYLSTSSDLVNWLAILDGEPIFDLTESYHLYKATQPSVYIENGVAYIYYTGISDQSDQDNSASICLVTVELDEIPKPLLTISNKALRILGIEEIESLTDTSRQAIRCYAAIEDVVKEILSMHPWNFSIVWSELSLSADHTPPFGYRYSYDLPATVLNVIDVRSIKSLTTKRSKFERGQYLKLYTDVSPCYARYVDYNADYLLQAPSLFITTCAYRLAIELNRALKTNMSGKIHEEYFRVLESAKLADTASNNITEPDRVQGSNILSSRGYPADNNTEDFWLS